MLPSPARRWIREPVLHFLIVGAALFAIDAAVSEPPATDDDRRVVLGPDVRAAVVERWTTTTGTEPTEEQIDREIARWRDEEILYREGLRLGLDRGDPAVRERIARKMAQTLGDKVVVPEPTDEELRAWHARHPDRWARPERVDFTHVFVSGSDDAARARAGELHDRLAAGADPARLGDTFQGGRRYRGRKLEDLAKTFGDGFADALRSAAPDTWQVVGSRLGWHVVRIDRKSAAEAPPFDEVRADVSSDWHAETRRTLQAAAMDEVRARWTVVTP